MPIGDPSLYPPDWKARSRAAIARAGNRCEECGVPNGAWITRRRGKDAWQEAGPSDLAGGPEDGEYLTRVVLTVHHVTPARDGGSHEPGNLRALCQLHHLRADMPIHIANAAATRARKDRERRAAAGQAALL
jgi:hypothetical protein